MKKWLALGAKIVVSGALIWWLFRGVDTDAALARVTAAAPGPLIAAAILMLAQVAVVAWRWKVVLDAIDARLPFSRVLKFFYISAFFNQALPASVGGDAVRVYKAHKAGLTLGAAVNSAMLDRVSALLAIAVMMVGLSPLLFGVVADPAARLGLMAMMGLAFGGTVVLMALDRMPGFLYRWRIVRGLAVLAADARRVFLTLRNTPRLIAVAILGHVLLSLAVWSLALALGIDVSPMDCVLLFPPVLLVSSLPISIAGWGVREGAMVAAFGFAGVAADAAFVLSILFGLALIVVNLPGGVVWLVGGERALPPQEPADSSSV